MSERERGGDGGGGGDSFVKLILEINKTAGGSDVHNLLRWIFKYKK